MRLKCPAALPSGTKQYIPPSLHPSCTLTRKKNKMSMSMSMFLLSTLYGPLEIVVIPVRVASGLEYLHGELQIERLSTVNIQLWEVLILLSVD